MSPAPHNFQKVYRADGWRYDGFGYRTRPWNTDGGSRITWQVERWDGANWIRVGDGDSYDDARRIAAEAQTAPLIRSAE